MRLKGDGRAPVSYSVQRAVDQVTHLELPNSPRHLVQGRISLPGPTNRSFVSVDGQYLSRRNTITGTEVPGSAVVNGTVTQPLGRSWELFGQVRNLFGARYADPASSQHMQDAIPQNGRTARIGLRLTLWRT